MFKTGNRVAVIPTGARGIVVEILRPGDRHPVRGVRVETSYSRMVFDSGEAVWFNDDVLEHVGEAT